MFLEMMEEFLEVVEGPTDQESARSFSDFGPGSTVFESGFETVDFSDLEEDPGGDFWVITLGFGEFATNVGKAADWDDVEVGVTFAKGAVSS